MKQQTLSKDMFNLLLEEKNMVMKEIKEYNETTPYYVYMLFDGPDPIYVGKGKGSRIFCHYNDLEGTNLKSMLLKFLFDNDCPPVPVIYRGNLNEREALNLEEQLISKFGRIRNGGKLFNTMPGGYYNVSKELNSLSGHKGGIKTRENNSGIFSASKEQRSEWGKIAASQVTNRSGCMTKEWHDKLKGSNPNFYKVNGNKAWDKISKEMLSEHKEWSKKGGIKTGKMKFWTDGTSTTRAFDCPGAGWVQGNCNVSQNSINNLSLPFWTNGIVNKKSEQQPEAGFFNGITCNSKDCYKKIIVYSKQIDYNNVPDYFESGKSYKFNEEEYNGFITSR